MFGHNINLLGSCLLALYIKLTIFRSPVDSTLVRPVWTLWVSSPHPLPLNFQSPMHHPQLYTQCHGETQLQPSHSPSSCHSCPCPWARVSASSPTALATAMPWAVPRHYPANSHSYCHSLSPRDSTPSHSLSWGALQCLSLNPWPQPNTECRGGVDRSIPSQSDKGSNKSSEKVSMIIYKHWAYSLKSKKCSKSSNSIEISVEILTKDDL